MVKAVVAADAIVGSLAGADGGNALRPVPIFPVFAYDLASAVTVRVTAFLKTPAVGVLRAVLARPRLRVILLARVAFVNVGFAYAVSVGKRVVVKTSAIFPQRTVHAIPFDAFLRVGTAHVHARVDQFASAPRPVRFIIVGTSASAFAVVNLIAGAPTPAVAVRFLAVIGTAAVVPRRTVLTRHVIITFLSVRT